VIRRPRLRRSSIPVCLALIILALTSLQVTSSEKLDKAALQELIRSLDAKPILKF
jgi:hypothetical protein